MVSLEDIFRLRVGDLLYYADTLSPFFEDTGINIVYLSQITDKKFAVKRFGFPRDEILHPDAYEEILFSDIKQLESKFPFAPIGRIFFVYLKKA